MAPGAGHPGGLAEQMVEQDVGGSGRIGRGEVADDPVEGEQGLGEVALEEAVEDVARALGRKFVDDAHFGRVEPDEVAAEAGERRQSAHPCPGFGRRFHDPFLDQRHDDVEFGIVAVIGGAVGGRVTRELGAGQPVTA